MHQSRPIRGSRVPADAAVQRVERGDLAPRSGPLLGELLKDEQLLTEGNTRQIWY